MAYRHLVLALGMVGAAVPLSATAFDPSIGYGAPAGTPATLYCLRTEPITGTKIGRIECLTREQWADGEVDVDEAWAKDGVRTIEGPPPTV